MNVAKQNCKTLNYYLATIGSKGEWIEFSKRFEGSPTSMIRISATPTIDKYMWNFTSGPEDGLPFFDFANSKCFYHCPVNAPNEPTFFEKKNSLAIGSASGKTVLYEVLDSTPLRYICESSDNYPFIPSVSTDGGIVDILNIDYSDDMEISMGGQPFCTTIHPGKGKIQCTVEKGTGVHKVRFGSKLSSNFKEVTFQYQAPSIQSIYPGGSSLTIVGSNFGEDGSKISVLVNFNQCIFSSFLDESSFECNLASKPTYILPIQVTVDGVESVPTYYLPIYNNETKKFVTLSDPIQNYGIMFQYANSKSVDYINGYLGVPKTESEFKFLGKYFSFTSNYWIGVYLLNNTFYYNNGPFKDQITTVYSSTAIDTLPENTSYYYTKDREIATTQTNAGTIVEYSILAPQYLNTDTLNYSTLGSQNFVTIGIKNFGDRFSKSTVYLGDEILKSCQRKFKEYPNVICVFPEGYGKNIPITIEIAGLKTVNTKYLSYNPPSLNCPTIIPQFDVKGSTYTIEGSNFYVNEKLIQVNVNGIINQALKMIENHKKISILIPPGSGTNIPYNVELGGQKSNSCSYSYLPPTILHASEIYYNQIGNVTITGTQFFNYKIQASIGGKNCNLIDYINNEKLVCLFNGTVEPPNKGQSLYVNVSINGQNTSNQVFFYTPNKECPIGLNGKVCSENGDCDTKTGQCLCKKGWDRNDCSLKINDNDGGVVDPETNEKGETSFSYSQVSFLIGIKNLREKKVGGTIVKSVSMEDLVWNITQKTNQYQELIGFFNNSMDPLLVILKLTNFKEKSNYTFAGQSMEMAENSIKYEVEIKEWKFENSLNTLEVICLAQTEKSTKKCNENYQTLYSSKENQNNNLSWFEIQMGESIMKARFSDRMFVDNKILKSKISILDGEDPLQNELESKDPSKFYLLSAITVPYFDTNAVIDPNFGVLVDPNFGCKDQTSSKNWKLPVIIVCSVVGACIIGVGMVLIIKKSLQGRRIGDVIKLNKFKNNS
eukprot:gene9335-11448_t